MRVHADEDGDHIEKALRLIDSVPDHEREALAQNLEQTTYAYRALLRDIVEHPSSAV